MIAMFSAMSLMCMDFALGAGALATPAREPLVVAALQQSPPAPEAVAPEAVAASDGEQFLGVLAFEGESDAAVVDKVTGYLEELGTLTGDFRQVAPSGAISTGRFYLRRPGMLRFEYDAPTPLLIVASGGIVYVRDEALETTDSYPVGKTPLKFLLRKKVTLGDARVIGVDRGVDTVAVTFASQEDETQGELTIIAKAPDLMLSRWIVRDLQNGITEVTLSNVVTGEKLANRLFRAPEAGGSFLKN